MSDPPIIPVLAAVFTRPDGTVLLARRRPELHNGGRWEFPGGKLRPDESPEACLRREIREELGVDIDVVAPYHLVRHRYPSIHILLIAYHCRLESEAWQLTDHDMVAWVRPDAMVHEVLSAADRAIADRLRERFPAGAPGTR